MPEMHLRSSTKKKNTKIQKIQRFTIHLSKQMKESLLSR